MKLTNSRRKREKNLCLRNFGVDKCFTKHEPTIKDNWWIGLRNFKTFVLHKTLLRKWKGKQKTERKYSQHMYLTKHLYLD